jgi:GT2 family glycosyltransferase
MESDPLVSIVTVNYNGLGDTLGLLHSIYHINKYENIEVVVVDNASEDDPTHSILSAHPSAIVIRNKTNLGFAGGNNVGLKQTKGKYVLLLNNDTEIFSDTVSCLLNQFAADARTGAVSPKIKYFDAPEVIQYAGFTKFTRYTLQNKTIGEGEEDIGQYDEVRQTPYFHGAAVMLSSAVIRNVGLMNEAYFLYYEELDWAVRIRKMGYNIYYQPKAEVLHKESVAVKRFSQGKIYYCTRNRLLFAKLHLSRFRFLMFFLYFTFLVLPVKVLKSYLAAEGRLFRRSFLKGYADFLDYTKSS